MTQPLQPSGMPPQPVAGADPTPAPAAQSVGVAPAPSMPSAPMPPPMAAAASSTPPQQPGQGAQPQFPQHATPPIQRVAPPDQPPDPAKSKNSFERLAGLIINQAQAQAEKLSQNLNEAPPNSRELSPDEVKQMWFHNLQGSVSAADQAFWQIHDQVLAQTGDHTQAEQQAMQQTYPYRPVLAQIGTAGAERQVALASQLRKTVDGEQMPDTKQVADEHADRATQIRQAYGRM